MVRLPLLLPGDIWSRNHPLNSSPENALLLYQQ